MVTITALLVPVLLSAVLAFAVIWYKRRWSTTATNTIDGLVLRPSHGQLVRLAVAVLSH